MLPLLEMSRAIGQVLATECLKIRDMFRPQENGSVPNQTYIEQQRKSYRSTVLAWKFAVEANRVPLPLFLDSQTPSPDPPAPANKKLRPARTPTHPNKSCVGQLS